MFYDEKSTTFTERSTKKPPYYAYEFSVSLVRSTRSKTLLKLGNGSSTNARLASENRFFARDPPHPCTVPNSYSYPFFLASSVGAIKQIKFLAE